MSCIGERRWLRLACARRCRCGEETSEPLNIVDRLPQKGQGSGEIWDVLWRRKAAARDNERLRVERRRPAGPESRVDGGIQRQESRGVRGARRHRQRRKGDIRKTRLRPYRRVSSSR